MLRGGRPAVAVLLAVACLSFAAAYASRPRTALADVWVHRVGQAGLEAAPVAFAVPEGPDQWFRPSGRNQGTKGLVRTLAELALHENAPLYVSSGWGRTSGSEASDHHVSRTDSWACDLAVRGVSTPTPATRAAAARIASALGEPGWQGGTLTKEISGYRIQVLWLVAGHFDHVHVGVRKLG
jgi:hypothetical protein